MKLMKRLDNLKTLGKSLTNQLKNFYKPPGTVFDPERSLRMMAR